MQIRQTRFMYSAPTDHESALDLWQCVCIIVKMVGWWGEREEEEEKNLGIYTETFWGVSISVERAQLSCPRHGKQWLPLG